MSPPKRKLQLETLEPRELMSVSSIGNFVGVVRDGQNWFLSGDQTSANAAQIRSFGQPGDRYLSGDWNSDGRIDLIAVRANAEGGLTWNVDTNGDLKADIQHKYGLASDQPFVGDWNGDRKLDLGVARRNSQSGGMDWYLDTTRVPYANPPARQFGLIGDTPVVGDWDGNGITDLGAVRPDGASGLLQWNLDTSGDPWPDIVRSYGLLITGDSPVTGDWNNDGKTDLGVTRNQAGMKWWYLDTTGDSFADVTQAFGFAGDTSVVGEWNRLAPLNVPPPPFTVTPPPPTQPVAPPVSVDVLSRIAPAPIFNAYPSSSFPDVRNKTFLDVDIGTISNGRTGEVAGATVSIRVRNGGTLFANARADDSGRVRFANLKLNERQVGIYQVVVNAPGYRTKVVDVPGYEVFLNVTYRDSDKGPSVVIAPPMDTRPPRTFVFLLPGFSTSSGNTGMHALASAMSKDPVFSKADVSVIPGAPIGNAMLANDRSFIERRLREAGATARDRVVIVGHSYGGEVARRIASDVRTDVPGAQPATAVVLIDPIDYVAAMASANIDQRNKVLAAPTGIPNGNILNIVQRSPNSTIFGYRLSAGITDEELGKGGDRRYGTRDDLVHTSLDDSAQVHQAVIGFLKSKL